MASFDSNEIRKKMRRIETQQRRNVEFKDIPPQLFDLLFESEVGGFHNFKHLSPYYNQKFSQLERKKCPNPPIYANRKWKCLHHPWFPPVKLRPFNVLCCYPEQITDFADLYRLINELSV